MIVDFAALDEGLGKLFALPDASAPETLQIMTVHKAKDLEFDTVIVPGLGCASPPPEPHLLRWIERPREGADPELLLAPVNATGEDGDPIYKTLADLDLDKERNELVRQLYVAATRAKHRLRLLGHVKSKAGNGASEITGPAASSLLASLWPAVRAQVEAARAFSSATRRQARLHGYAPGRGDSPGNDAPRRRLVESGQSARCPLGPVPERGALQDDVEFSWAGERARHVGTVVHRWLQVIAVDAARESNAGRVAALSPALRTELAPLVYHRQTRRKPRNA